MKRNPLEQVHIPKPTTVSQPGRSTASMRPSGSLHALYASASFGRAEVLPVRIRRASRTRMFNERAHGD